MWVDTRNLRGGDTLRKEIEEAIEQAAQVMAVLSPATANSAWVRKEIAKALEVKQRRQDSGYRVIPLLLPGIEPSALELWFGDEPVAMPVHVKVYELQQDMPRILQALGADLPTGRQGEAVVAAKPLADLVLRLSDPRFVTEAGKRRAAATAMLVYEPIDKSVRPIEST